MTDDGDGKADIIITHSHHFWWNIPQQTPASWGENLLRFLFDSTSWNICCSLGVFPLFTLAYRISSYIYICVASWNQVKWLLFFLNQVFWDLRVVSLTYVLRPLCNIASLAIHGIIFGAVLRYLSHFCFFFLTSSLKTTSSLSLSLFSVLIFLAPNLGKTVVLILLQSGFIQELNSVKYWEVLVIL